MKNINTQTMDTNSLKLRVQALRPTMPYFWKREFIKAFPEYDNLEGVTLVSNVGNLRQVDEAVIEKMEKIFSQESQKAKA